MSDTTQTPVGQEGENQKIWLRGFYMLAFFFFFTIAKTALGLMALIQFFWLLFTGAPNPALRRFGVSLGNWMLEVVDFQTCVSEEKPFPWKSWPSDN